MGEGVNGTDMYKYGDNAVDAFPVGVLCTIGELEVSEQP